MKKAVLSMGLPGSGKSTCLKNNFNLSNFVIIDPDEIKKEQLDYDPKNPSVYHNWSKTQAKIRTLLAISESKNLVIDGTGTNVEKMYKQIIDLQVEGYEVELFYVKVKLETAIFRNSKRDRNVPESIIFEKFETISYAFEILSTIANRITVVNND